jgi:murein DD-endopeptidase MepM/ murein hydrolase activator NlpD
MNQLRSLRTSRALSYLDLAAISGIPARMLAEAELGLTALSGQQYQRLAFVLGVGTQRLLAPAVSPVASLPTLRHSMQLPSALVALAVAGSMVASLGAAQHLPAWQAPQPAPITAVQPAEPVAKPATSGGSLRSAPLMPGAGTTAPQAAAEPAASANNSALAAPASGNQPASPQLLLAALPPPQPIPLPPVQQSQAQTLRFQMSENGPLGCPVAPTNGRVVMTQGYGVGSHAPAATWGAIDLAVDSDGDGYAEPAASWYTPIMATHDGVVTVTLDSYPAGNHVWVRSGDTPWRTGYAHLALVTVISGQYVRAGEVIGMLGSTGVSSGPHLDYQVWNGEVNVDPTGLVGCSD